MTEIIIIRMTEVIIGIITMVLRQLNCILLLENKNSEETMITTGILWKGIITQDNEIQVEITVLTSLKQDFGMGNMKTVVMIG